MSVGSGIAVAGVWAFAALALVSGRTTNSAAWVAIAIAIFVTLQVTP